MNSIKLKNDNMIVIFVVLLMIVCRINLHVLFQTSIILNLILIKKDGIPNIILKYPLLYYLQLYVSIYVNYLFFIESKHLSSKNVIFLSLFFSTIMLMKLYLRIYKYTYYLFHIFCILHLCSSLYQFSISAYFFYNNQTACILSYILINNYPYI